MLGSLLVVHSVTGVFTWVDGSYVAVVLMALVLLPWLSSVSAKHPYVLIDKKILGKGPLLCKVHCANFF